MLPVDVENLAEHLYQQWCISARRQKLWNSGNRTVAWADIGDEQRQCWIDVAARACRIMADELAKA